MAPGGVYSNRVYGFHGGTFAAIRARPYVYPHGYAYRPFYAGQRFPAFLLLSAYFILNWNLYNLTPPPDPALVWVRFGPDALLVNTYTGQVLDVAPRIFDEGEPPPSGYAPQAFSDGPAPPPPGAADQYEGPAPQSPAARDPQTDSDGTPYPGPTGYREPPPPIAVPQG